MIRSEGNSNCFIQTKQNRCQSADKDPKQVNKFRKLIYYIIIVLMFFGFSSFAEDDESLVLDYAKSTRVKLNEQNDILYIRGPLKFSIAGGQIYADSAIHVIGESISLKYNVSIEDSLYQLLADSVYYDVKNRLAYAYGKKVVIISEKDSLRIEGTNAYYSRDSAIFRMSDRPILFLNYPDSSRLVNIEADYIAFEGKSKIGYADGDVVILQSGTRTNSERAILYDEDEVVALYGSPVARRKESEIIGDTLILFSHNSALRKIFVQGNGQGYFKESIQEDTTIYDLSELDGDEIEFHFLNGFLDSIISRGQVHSFYEPGTSDSISLIKNYVSGDSIKLYMENELLSLIQIIGGAEGEYISGEFKTDDSGIIQFIEDTVFYRADFINYYMDDSTIDLINNSFVNNKNITLTAGRIDYNTSQTLVTAYDDSTIVDSAMEYIPVVLKDGSDEVIGSYLEYSMETRKGLIKQSQSGFEESYYRGKELFREKKEIFYVNDGLMTSCDLEEPHWHFRAANMKVIHGDRVIARPVILYIEKVPLLIIPYYVFPLKSGRHSGFLPFKFGNFERGSRFIKNVGYYWAASDYWDLLGSFNYSEGYGFTYNAAFKYNLRYHFSGGVSGSYISESQFVNYTEQKTKRWSLRFNHSHTVSPTFRVMADGHFISDKSYYTDYSTNDNDRLNRSLKSQVSFSKKLGKASLSAQFVHTDNLDIESRSDYLPSAKFSIPSFPVFGSSSGSKGDKKSRRWYQNIYSGYNVSLRNFSQRSTNDSGRTRREYLTVDHNTNLSSPFKILRYLKLNPSFRYRETWYKVFETDQSISSSIDATTAYRRYAYSSSISTSTDLYGTLNSNIFILQGFRHVMTPSVGFSWAPDIDRHNEIKSYTGTGGGGAKQKTMQFNLRQLFQAKIKSGDESKKLDLLTLSTSCNYNFEATGKRFSNLSTSIQTSLLKNLKLSASMIHDLYRPRSEELQWWSPYLQSFSISSTFNTSGILGQYESEEKSDQSNKKSSKNKSRQNWNLSVSHRYSESGLSSSFNKTHTINFNFRINLTPNLMLSYRQYYDIGRHKTVSRFLEVERKLHCWEGRFSWNIDSSNKGFQFRINVISIPDIKFEKSESGVRDSFF